MTGTLVLAATPIGRVGDAPPRLAEELAGADVVAAEDTRRLKRLCDDLGITLSGRVVSYFDGNEAARTPVLVEALTAGQRVVLVTDAGMPSVSDPGYRLVLAALEAGIVVTAVPGPSAVLTALAVSGLPVDRFCFEGFLSRRAGERASALAALATEPRTMVFFEAPHRLARTLSDLAGALGPTRAVALARELTKLHEEVWRGSLAGAIDRCAEVEPRGEYVLVVAGAPAPVAATDDELAAAVADEIGQGRSTRDAVALVAGRFDVSKRRVYDLANRPVPADSRAEDQAEDQAGDQAGESVTPPS
jgi:16S rRNA (cytidine1402-2'-O)-methyltransferase